MGRHAEATCVDCHGADINAPLSSSCASCHEEDRPVDHFPGDCGDCHGAEDWGTLEVDHSFFPLELSHDRPVCTECHAADTFEGLDPACSSCHEEDRPVDHYEGDCVDCHTIAGWMEATVDHDQYLSLAGGHNALACNSCHATDTYTGLDNACESCHDGDDPANHFTGPCVTCHTVFGWSDANFSHPPPMRVPHNGVRECVSCHTDPTTYDTFSCIDCHEHRKNKMDAQHQGETNNYRWESAACFNCHPQGRE